MNRLTWVEICERYPDECVLLAVTDKDDVRTIMFARALDHEESIDIMDQNEPLPGTTLIQTAGRPLWWLTRPRLILDPDEGVPGLSPGASFIVAKRRRTTRGEILPRCSRSTRIRSDVSGRRDPLTYRDDCKATDSWSIVIVSVGFESPVRTTQVRRGSSHCHATTTNFRLPRAPSIARTR